MSLSNKLCYNNYFNNIFNLIKSTFAYFYIIIYNCYFINERNTKLHKTFQILFI